MSKNKMFDESSKQIKSPTVYGIGTKFKFMQEAYFDEEPGDRSQRVEVIDRRKEDGKIFRFAWERWKSNDNLKDMRDRKGFTFFFARQAYYDDYMLECPELATGENTTAFVGQILDEKDQKFDNIPTLIVIQATDEKDFIKIASAYRRDIDHKSMMPYVKNYMIKSRKREIVRRVGTFESVNTFSNEIFDIIEPGSITRANEEFFRRTVSSKDASD